MRINLHGNTLRRVMAYAESKDLSMTAATVQMLNTHWDSLDLTEGTLVAKGELKNGEIKKDR